MKLLTRRAALLARRHRLRGQAQEREARDPPGSHLHQAGRGVMWWACVMSGGSRGRSGHRLNVNNSKLLPTLNNVSGFRER